MIFSGLATPSAKTKVCLLAAECNNASPQRTFLKHAVLHSVFRCLDLEGGARKIDDPLHWTSRSVGGKYNFRRGRNTEMFEDFVDYEETT